jgi:apolipoprotein N-acyltransferase
MAGRWVLLCGLGGALMAAAAPAPLGVWPLAWVALVPLWWLSARSAEPVQPAVPLKEQLRGQLRGQIGAAIAWGLAYHGLALSWITGLHPLTWMGIGWWSSVAITALAWGFISVWGAILVSCWVLGMGGLDWLGMRLKSGQRPPAALRILVGTALWCALEVIWAQGPLWWTSLSYTQSPGNLWILHLGQLSGPTAVVSALVAVNGLLAEASWPWLSQRWDKSGTKKTARFSQGQHFRGWLAGALGLCLLCHAVGYALYAQPLGDRPDQKFTTGLIQGNIPTRQKFSAAGIQQTWENYVGGYQTLADQGVDLVATPEGALPFLWTPQGQMAHAFDRAVRQRGIPALLGTFVADGQGNYTQSILSLTTGKNAPPSVQELIQQQVPSQQVPSQQVPSQRVLIQGNASGQTSQRILTPEVPTQVLGQYSKFKLVPLGEYLPFRHLLGSVMGRLSPVQADLVPPASPVQTFKTPFGQAAVGICYESAFAQLFQAQVQRGGEWLLTASNLDPYSQVLMAQQEALDRMRAIEGDRWLVRVTNTGYSGAIDPHGQVQGRSRPNQYQSSVVSIFRRQSLTPYVRWGDWLWGSLLVVSCGAIALFFGKNR